MPIEFVTFSKDLMEFDGFKIQTFNKGELDDLLKQPVCRLFYPWVLVDTEELASYWFLVLKTKQNCHLAGIWIGAPKSRLDIRRSLER